jgi:hypothetical protein
MEMFPKNNVSHGAAKGKKYLLIPRATHHAELRAGVDLFVMHLRASLKKSAIIDPAPCSGGADSEEWRREDLSSRANLASVQAKRLEGRDLALSSSPGR